MSEKVKKTIKKTESEQKILELTQDLQRTRADFENYRKRVEADMAASRLLGRSGAILQILPVIDNIERATNHLPEELKDNTWAQGVVNLVKSLEKSLVSLHLEKIKADPGDIFNPEFHEAIQFDENSEGENEVIAEQLQTGYLLDGQPIRHAMVKVKRQ